MRTRIPGTCSFGHIAISAFCALILAGCGGKSDSAPGGTFEVPEVAWNMVFEDAFEGATALDTTKWNVQTGDGCPTLCGWGNNESQVYSASNIEVSGNTLKLIARQEQDGSYTSARINTQDKFEFRYGRVEFSARLPSGQGIWPALWMLHAEELYGPWPVSGEIDVMEAFNPGVMSNTATQSTLHYGLPGLPFSGTSSQNDNMVALDAAFHEYAIEWERDQIRFFVDDVHFQTQTSDEWYAYYPADEDGNYDPLGPYRQGPRDAPFDKDFYLLMNLAVGGNPVGSPVGTTFPQTLEIDYVRVYECMNANPETGRGCGSGNRSVVGLEDGDGGPLEGMDTGQPFQERLDLYIDGPEAITVATPHGDAVNQLTVDGFTGEGATVTSDPDFTDPDDPENKVWRVAISGATSNVFLASQVFMDNPLIETGFDFSGGRRTGQGTDPFGEIAFDMEIVSMDQGATLVVKLDSGFPNLGEAAIPAEALAMPGVRKTYSIKFQDLIENPGFVDCCGGQGVNLANVVNPFVLEVEGGAAEVYLDNIYVTNACKVVGGCGADLRLLVPNLVIFDDTVNEEVWDRGLVASDSGSGFADYTNATDSENKVNWRIVAAEDTNRGDVIEVTFNDSSASGVFFIGSSVGRDISAYNAGALVFDLLVTDYGMNTTGMTMKIDCFHPCSSGDRALGVVADDAWETITVPLSALRLLDLENVNTGIVIFPTAPQTGGITFQLDNVRFVAETAAAPPVVADLPVTFDDTAVTYSPVDFGGASTVVGMDPADENNMVAATTKPTGSEVWAGTVVTSPEFSSAIPFAEGATTLSVRVRAPAADIPVRLKVEEMVANDQTSAEFNVDTTVANTYETLVFDFSTQDSFDVSTSYIRTSIFFDFGSAGDDAVYYWEDLRLGTPVGLPVSFDEEGRSYQFVDFGGAGTVLADDPDGSDNTVAQTTKGAGSETWAGTIVGDGKGFVSPIPFAAGSTTMTVRVRAPATNIPVRLKIEGADAATVFAEVEARTTAANTWETLSFDFSSPVSGSFNASMRYIQTVIFFDFGTEGDDAVYYWDDLAL